MKFTDLNLNNPLLNALDDLGFVIPTPIQSKCYSPIMAGRDVLGIAQTGTGKTFAYLIPIIRLWQFSKKKVPTVLVIVPTRELVVQVTEEFQSLAKYTGMIAVGTYGGTNIKTQAAEIVQGADVVVGTPERVNDLILNGAINPRQIKKIVIDEVDHLMKLGFRTSLKNLLDLLPERKQTLMFTATITEDIEDLIEQDFHLIEKIEDAPTGTPLEGISQFYYEAPNFHSKKNLLEHLLLNHAEMNKVLVFAGDKRMADRIHASLSSQFDDQVAVIHGNKSSNRRFRTVDEFENGECRILVASDLMARGMDISDVSHVVNFTIPDVPEDYIHRIGRTGRAEKSGVAISLLSEAELESFQNIESLMNLQMTKLGWPEDVEISKVLLPEEEDRSGMKIIKVRQPKVADKGAAFHEKLDKNKKTNNKVTRADKMKLKYGKKYESGHGSGSR